MALTDAEKVDIRRYCGFQMFGGQPVQAFGHRFYTHYGTLEFRMTNMLPEEEVVARQFLTDLHGLEADIPASRDNLDTDQAAVWKHNSKEVRDRTRLYRQWRRELCAFIGIPPGPGLTPGGIRLVV